MSNTLTLTGFKPAEKFARASKPGKSFSRLECARQVLELDTPANREAYAVELPDVKKLMQHRVQNADTGEVSTIQDLIYKNATTLADAICISHDIDTEAVFAASTQMMEIKAIIDKVERDGQRFAAGHSNTDPYRECSFPEDPAYVAGWLTSFKTAEDRAAKLDDLEQLDSPWGYAAMIVAASIQVEPTVPPAEAETEPAGANRKGK